jgi:hypothetical protein
MTPAGSVTTRTETLFDVPAADLEAISAQFQAAGATVTAERQLDGRWTVIAAFVVAAP